MLERSSYAIMGLIPCDAPCMPRIRPPAPLALWV